MIPSIIELIGLAEFSCWLGASVLPPEADSVCCMDVGWQLDPQPSVNSVGPFVFIFKVLGCTSSPPCAVVLASMACIFVPLSLRCREAERLKFRRDCLVGVAHGLVRGCIHHHPLLGYGDGQRLLFGKPLLEYQPVRSRDGVGR